MKISPEPFDVLIIGAGAAGLTTALRLPAELRVAVVAKGPLDLGCTLWAQGGIAAVLDATDSLDAHVQDTLEAGAGLCHEAAVRQVVEHGRAAVEWLDAQGVAFSTDSQGAFDLGREGGHGNRRIAHADDATGRAIEHALVARVRERANIVLFEHHVAIDLIIRHDATQRRCVGAYFLDRRQDRVVPLAARATVLATGGASKVYLYSSNPDITTGDGIAMAWRAGCRVANLEFNQFHPTCLFHPKAKSLLISEAVRGEGGRLLLPSGEPFMQRFDPRGELAPRDIVARAIDHEMKRLGSEHVLLDISHKPEAFVRERFPNLYRRCLAYGFDMTRDPLPVVPAAHYTCGGVVTDLDGRTDLAGLYAVGEVAFTGLHGANRLASNSLLECLVFGQKAAEHIASTLHAYPVLPDLPPWDESRVTDSDEAVVVTHNWDELRRTMWDYVGIVRTDKRLLRARQRIELLRREVEDYYAHFRVTNDLIELRNLALVAELIVHCALRRKESRGLHYSLDYPVTATETSVHDTLLTP